MCEEADSALRMSDVCTDVKMLWKRKPDAAAAAVDFPGGPVT